MPTNDLVDIYPLSPMQQGLLFHSLAEPESGLYVIQFHCLFQGNFDLHAFRQTWQQVMNRHAVLRTEFDWESADEPLQLVFRYVQVTLRQEDWRQFSTGIQQLQLDEWLRQDRLRGFDLSCAPLLRLTLIRVTDDTYRFILSVSHALLDGRSLSLIMQEVLTYYENISLGRDIYLESPAPYKNYIAWLQRQNPADAEKFWRKVLEGVAAATPFTLSKHKSGSTLAIANGEYPNYRVYLSEPVTIALQSFAKKYKLTLGTLIQGAWALLLSWYSDEKDVVFGTTVSSSPADLSGAENMVGMFLNTLPLRTQLHPKSAILSWLTQLQEEQAQARQYNYSSLAQVQGWSGLPPEQPLFESILTFTNASVDRALLEEYQCLKISDNHLINKTNYPLAIWVEPGRQLAVEFMYDARRFEAQTIHHMADHFQTLLERIIANPEQRLSTLSPLTDAEVEQLLITFNSLRQELPSQINSVIELFEQFAANEPESLAVTFGNEYLTYSDLNERANQLAHYLRSLGVGPEGVVGLCLQRSLDLVVAIVGVLKTGGAYLSLDFRYPQERLVYMLTDSQVSVVLTQSGIFGANNESPQTKFVYLDRDWSTIAQGDTENPQVLVMPENLAYVIYTSGSTGQPKGVMVPHQGLLNLSFWHQQVFAITSQDRATQVAGLAFDASVWELWPYLAAGASVHLVPDEEIRTDPQRLRDWLVATDITISFLPTPLAEAIVELAWPRDGVLRYLLTGGDRLHQYPPATLPFELINNYGPTENSVVATFGHVMPQDREWDVPSIGRPVNNVQVYLLNDDMQPVLVGATGHLYLGGMSLARGYLGRPALTAERFMPNPFSDEPGGRLYQTGDLARWRPNGEIEFLGRDDEQVKIRGYRIELGEVENAIGQHPLVREAVVVLRDAGSGDPRLVAYIVTRQETVLLTETLGSFLRKRLPDYMIPGVFVFMEALPLTPNGKVDRRTLPVPDFSHTQMEGQPEPPHTRTERLLAEIWCQVLGRKEIGIHDNFFLSGGDSILSIRVVARATQAGVHLTPKQLFEHPTISELATIADDAPTVQSEQGPVTGPVQLTPIQCWLFEQQLVEPSYYNQAVLLKTKEHMEPKWLEQALQHIITHHDALRLRFNWDGIIWRQFSDSLESPVSLLRVDLSDVPAEEQHRRIEEISAQVQASLDLNTGSLLRAALFDLGQEMSGRLLLVIHHLVVDTVSWSILLEDLARTYEQLRRNQPVQLPAKTTSFKAWAEKLAMHAQSEAIHQEISYWLSHLDQSSVDQFVDFAEGIEANTEASAERVTVWLSIEETKSLLMDVPQAYRTQANEILLMALFQAVRRQTGQNHLLVDLEGHGREQLFSDVDISRTVGWFTTIYPVFLTVPDPDNLDQMIKMVKEHLRHVPTRGLGYGLLRYLSSDNQIVTKLQHLPSTGILFNYLGQFDSNLTLSELFGLAEEAIGPMRSPLGRRPYLLEVIGSIADGRLQVDWVYSRNVHKRTRIEELASTFVEALRMLISFCQLPEAGGYTPSDFPLARLNQVQLDRLAAAYSQIEDIYPLTPAQQGMFFHALYQPESEVYFGQSHMILTSTLNVPAFKQAWYQVIARHPILRTSFIWQEVQQPLQVVHHEVTLPWHQDDWRGLSVESREKQWQTLLEADRQRGFDLSQAPVMRMTLIRMTDEVHYFAWSTHHIILDGWSLSVLLREVFATYAALDKGHIVELDRAYPYRHYVAWLQKQELSSAEAFWRQALVGFKEPTPLTIGRQMSSHSKQHFAEERIQLPASVTTCLKTLAQSHELTFNTILQGVWAILLGHYSQQKDVVFGCTVSGRPSDLTGVESIVGPFISVLPLRVHLPSDGSFWRWLAGLQGYQVEMRQYEFVSLAQIQRWSQITPPRPLFESMLVFESATMFDPTQIGFNKQQVQLADAFVRNNFPFTVKVVPWHELEIHILYEIDRFETDTVRHVLAQFIAVLERLVAETEVKLDELRYLANEMDQKFRVRREQESEASSLEKLKQVRRKAVHKVQR